MYITKLHFTGHEEEVPGYQALYICTNDQGELYIKRGENSEEVNEYIKTSARRMMLWNLTTRSPWNIMN